MFMYIRCIKNSLHEIALNVAKRYESFEYYRLFIGTYDVK